MSIAELGEFILAAYLEPRFILAALFAFIAGLVRGFAGFGAGMVFMPLASSIVAPQTTAAGFLVMDGVLTLPLVIGALRHCQWFTVIPTALSAMAVIPLGAWVLANGDPLVLRWVISGVVLALLALLLTGWRYHREPTTPASLAVGAVAGFLSGVTQVSGPPVVAFWISGPAPAQVIRANLIVFFFLAGLSAFVAFTSQGFYTAETFRLIAVTTPLYALAIIIGVRGFNRASESLYRRVAFALIGLAAVTGLPVLDVLLR